MGASAVFIKAGRRSDMKLKLKRGITISIGSRDDRSNFRWRGSKSAIFG
jgi:hypothetical protein